MSKTVVITGGNGGIGKAAAVALAKKGYNIIIHGRNPEKVKSAVNEIIARSGNQQVDSVTADVSTIAGMRKMVADIQSKTDVIDILILSTGIILPKREETADGLEAAFATQYLSRWYAATKLLPLLKKSKFARIVVVGAPTMKKAKIHFDDISLKKDFSMMKSMGQCMLATHMLVQEFAKRHPNENVVINMHHVGIAKTGVVREVNWFFKMLVKLFGSDPNKAARNTVFLADNDVVTYTGYFLPKPGKPERKDLIQFDPFITNELWQLSEKLTS